MIFRGLRLDGSLLRDYPHASGLPKHQITARVSSRPNRPGKAGTLRLFEECKWLQGSPEITKDLRCQCRTSYVSDTLRPANTAEPHESSLAGEVVVPQFRKSNKQPLMMESPSRTSLSCSLT